ncbi:hypothetical protein Y032_0202g1779 [Ancylostoma ceylanicum]|uniref:ascorbate ferrireductase (transmembrane) n=2 Tax=Ancylostoma ceylanicum TaxID=53326 RepID=A0A016SN32_9BILA|nr:hypothetical protein Y032_0202g1779 [Ancylostoma ceylanicum]
MATLFVEHGGKMLAHLAAGLAVLLCYETPFALAQFDASTCGQTKGCYIPKPGLGFSYQVVSDSYIDIELSAEVDSSNRFVAVAFASGTVSPPSVECSTVDDQPPTIHIPHNDDISHLRIPNESTFRQQYFSNVSTSFSNGTLYCRARLLVKGENDPNFLTYVPTAEYTIKITEGPIQRGERVVAQTFTSSPLALDATTPKPKPKYKLDVVTRRKLIKAHSVLQVLAWFFFVPTAFVFARFLKNEWTGTKACGVTVWYQVHRVSNMIGIILMIASFVCVLVCKDWRWTGPGSQSHYHTKTHTMVGLVAMILAWLQPICSLFRCAPDHRNRWLFNWGHRFTGVAAFALATAATAITALEFKIWQERELQLVLVLSPSVILIALIVIFLFIDSATDPEKDVDNSVKTLRVSLVFLALGLLMAASIWMSFLLATGYKNAK